MINCAAFLSKLCVTMGNVSAIMSTKKRRESSDKKKKQTNKQTNKKTSS